VDFATANGTALSPGDYAGLAGTLTFAPGVTTQQITIAVVGDAVSAATETFQVNLTNALNAAYDRVIRSRSHTAGRVRELSELAGVLNSAAALVEGAVAAARSGTAADPADVATVPSRSAIA